MAAARKLKVAEKEKPIVDPAKVKRDRKTVSLKRKKIKDLTDLVDKSKKIYEMLRVKKFEGGKENRLKLVHELHAMLKGENYRKVIFRRYMSRVVQCMIKYAPPAIIEDIKDSIIDLIPELLSSVYGSYCVNKLFKYGSANVRTELFNSLHGHIVKLTSKAFAAKVIDHAYQNFASEIQKKHILQEFYSELYSKNKNDSIDHVRDVYEKTALMKDATLNSMKETLIKLLSKDTIDTVYFHTLILQYLSECSKTGLEEMLAILCEHIAVLALSEDGSRVAMKCIWHAQNKQRKSMLKIIKGHLQKLVCHKYGHQVVITMLDNIDDTVLLEKMILSKIVAEISFYAQNDIAKKVLLWLIAPDDKSIFGEAFLKDLKDGRDVSISRKSTEIRRNEVLNYFIRPMSVFILDNFDWWTSKTDVALITFLAMTKLKDMEILNKAYVMLANFIVNPNWTVPISDAKTTVHGIEHIVFASHVSKLITMDTDNVFKSELTKHFENVSICKFFLSRNRGCFLMIKMLEFKPQWDSVKLLVMLRSQQNFLKQQKFMGAEILLKKLETVVS